MGKVASNFVFIDLFELFTTIPAGALPLLSCVDFAPSGQPVRLSVMNWRVITPCSVSSYRGKTYSLSPPNPFASSMPFRNRRLIMGASVPYRVVLFGRLWLNKREAASVPYELVIATTNKRLYRQSRRRTMALSTLI